MRGPPWRAGDALPELRLPPVARAELARYAAASGDRNPIHLHDEAAERAGLPGVIQHGMLTMGQLGRLFSPTLGDALLRSYALRFTGMVFLGEELVLRGRVEEASPAEGGTLVRLSLAAATASGRDVARGHAELLLHDGWNSQRGGPGPSGSPPSPPRKATP